MSSYQFQQALFPTRAAMLDEIASQWITAGGNNPREFVREILAEQSDESLAAETIDGWDLAALGSDDDPSHSEVYGYDESDLAAAFKRLRNDWSNAA